MQVVTLDQKIPDEDWLSRSSKFLRSICLIILAKFCVFLSMAATFDFIVVGGRLSLVSSRAQFLSVNTFQ
jgi:hypothetical protein